MYNIYKSVIYISECRIIGLELLTECAHTHMGPTAPQKSYALVFKVIAWNMEVSI